MAPGNAFRLKKVGFIGAGNMGQAVVKGLIDGGQNPDSIFITTKTTEKLPKLKEKLGVNTFENNEEIVEHADVVVLAVKPQDLYEVIEPFAMSFTDDKIVISMAAGIPLSSLRKWIPNVKKIFRIMPNTPATLGKAVVGYCCTREADNLKEDFAEFLQPLGQIIYADEGDEFEALTVAAASGVGFVFEIMTYWQEWLSEHGFGKDEARKITVQTFLGTAMLAEAQESVSIEDLQKKVVSKKGVTHAGLVSMRELELERVLRYSFEKAVLRDRQLGQNS